MSPGPLHAVVRHLRHLTAPPGGPSSDGELLRRFAAQRDEAAFAEIVQRHGPLVWALCRSGLPAADAEDAFQATFVVLARQAHHIRKPQALACWLSGVARRVVRRLRTQDARRRQVEGRIEPRAGGEPTDALERQEWRAVLDEELHRLPEKYRLPLLLCYYQGLTNEEAARRLAWPHGTVCGRLARARELLRGRLTRRGVTLAVGALAAGTAGPPSELLAATLRACGGWPEAGAAALKTSVGKLAEEVMNAMWLNKLRLWAAGVVAVGLLSGGAAGWALRPASAQATKTPSVPTREEAKTSNPPVVSNPTATTAAPADELGKLLRDRLVAATNEYQARMQLFTMGKEQIPFLQECAKRLLEAEVDAGANADERVKAYERYLKTMQDIENINKQRFEVGRIGIQDLEESKYHRLDAEIKLLRAKREAAPVQKKP